MDSKPEAEWPDELTREEMLEQQSRLLREECRLLRDDLARYRQNIAKLVNMNAEVAIERDKLRSEMKVARELLQRKENESYEQSREIGSLQRVVHQHRAVMREHNVPEQLYDYKTTTDLGDQGPSLKNT